MKKLLILVALISFTAGLNATVTKDDICNTNPALFKQLKEELKTLNKQQTEKLKKAYVKEQINQAFKLVFSNKEILKNANYAVIRNGKILKVGNSKDVDGLSLWHEHLFSLENPPAENTCEIRDTSWQNIGSTAVNNTCGFIYYQLSPDTTYNISRLLPPRLMLLPDMTDPSEINNLYTQATDNVDALHDLSIHYYYDTTSSDRLERLQNFESIDDIVAGTVYTQLGSDNMTFIHKGTYPPLYTNNWDRFNLYYRPTENYTPDTSTNLLTLKSGYYIQLLQTGEYLTENWWDGFTVIFKWLRLKVDNYYLGDVGVEEHNSNNAANITWNNHQIKIDLSESVNPATTTYELYDISGRLIQKELLSSHQTIHNMPTLTSSGIYVIRVKGKNLSLSKKIVFKK